MRDEAAASPTISIVLPVYDEADVLDLFFAELVRTLAALEMPAQIVAVDDGSRDDSLARLEEIQRTLPELAIVRLARNFGKEAAVCAGLDVAHGDAVVVMDADLQDPPELIPAFVAEWRRGAQIVYGARRDRSDDSWPKRATASAFYRTFNRMAPQQIPMDAGDFRLMDRQVVEVLRLMPERSRFMKGLFAWPGFTSAAIPFDRPARPAGKSKWPGRRLWSYGLTGIFSFSAVPVRLWSYVGAAIVSAGGLFAMVVVVRALLGIDSLPGYASTIVLITVLSGLQILGLGILGEYISRTLEEAKGRPLYVVASSDALPILSPSGRPEIDTFEIAARAAARQPDKEAFRGPT